VTTLLDNHTDPFANQGIPVRADYQYAIMHNKFIVVDGQTVELGSFNFTAAAEDKNAENVIVLHDSAVAQRYSQEWNHPERSVPSAEELFRTAHECPEAVGPRRCRHRGRSPESHRRSV